MIEGLRRAVARWLDPEVYERHGRLVHNLDELAGACAYDFPTVRIVRDFALRSSKLEVSPPTVEEVRALLEREHAGHEPLELVERLERALLELYGDG